MEKVNRSILILTLVLASMAAAIPIAYGQLIIFQDNFDADPVQTYTSPNNLPGWTYGGGGPPTVFDLGGGNHSAGVANNAESSSIKQYVGVSGQSQLDIYFDVRFMYIRPQRDTFTSAGISLRPLPYGPERQIQLQLFGDSSVRLFLDGSYATPLASFTYTGGDIFQAGDWQSMRMSVDILAGSVTAYDLTKSGNTPLFTYTDASLFNNGSGNNVQLLYLQGDYAASKNALSQFDNIVVYDSVVPEPSLISLLVVGFGLLGFSALRKRRSLLGR